MIAGLDGYRGDLNRRCVTIAEALKPAGYRNYVVGKWHVTPKVEPEGRIADTTTGRCSADSTASTARFTARAASSIRTRSRGTTRSSRHSRDPEYRPERVLLHRRDQRPCGAFRPRAPGDHAQPAVLHLRGATPPRTGRCTRRRSDIAKYHGQVRRRLRRDPRGALGEARSNSAWWMPGGRMSPQAGDWRRGEGSRVRDALHGGLCRDGRLHGSGHRPDRRELKAQGSSKTRSSSSSRTMAAAPKG